MCGTAAGHARDDEGAAALEFALVTPILVLLLFGIIVFGIYLNRVLVVNEAAAQAARDAVVGRMSTGDDQDSPDYANVQVDVSKSYDHDSWWDGYHHDYSNWDSRSWGGWGSDSDAPWATTYTAVAHQDFSMSYVKIDSKGHLVPASLTKTITATVTMRDLRGWTDHHWYDDDHH